MTAFFNSTISFYTSIDGKVWNKVGVSRTTGKVIEFNSNEGFIEVGGHSDGQSFGNTFLESEVKDLSIITANGKEFILFTPENNGVDFFVYKPNTLDPYNKRLHTPKMD